MTNRRHPAAAFWLTVTLVVVLVGYQLSFGPACWAIDRGWIGYEYPRIVYWPIGKTFRPLPSPFQRAILWWGEVGSTNGISADALLVYIIWFD